MNNDLHAKQPKILTAHASLLNRLSEMQKSIVYATAKPTISEAELLILQQEQRIHELEAKLAEAEKDAERYRWLRYRNNSEEMPKTSGIALDRALDAAIAAAKEQKP